MRQSSTGLLFRHYASVTIFAFLAVTLGWSTLVQAHSRRANPLKRIAYASDASIEIVKRNLYAEGSESHSTRRSSAPTHILSSDSIRLSLRAFDQTFYLHLDPNDHIVPPQGATLNVWGWDAEKGKEVLQSKQVIAREDVRAYHGVVVHPSYTRKRMFEDELGVSRTLSGISDQEGVVGTATILLHDDGSASGDGSPRFEGSFDWRGNQHTIQTSRNYHVGRHSSDPSVHRRSIELSHLIVHRDSDLMSNHEASEWLQARGEDFSQASTSSCSHDGHEYNLNNHLLLTDANNDNSSRSPLDFFASPDQGSGSVHSAQSLLRRGLSALDLFNGEETSQTDDGELVATAWQGVESRDSFRYDYEPHQLLSRQTTGSDTGGNGGNRSFVNAIGNTQGCPKSAQVVYVGMAADCTFTQAMGGEVSNTSATLLNIMNTVSNVYRNTFNVSLGVVELDVRSATCPSTANSAVPWNVGCNNLSLDQRLSSFSAWRGAQPANGTGLWHLLTACTTTTSSGEIGVAWLGTLCKTDSDSSGSDTVSGTGVTSNTNRNAQVVAHEMGHNFGAIHDCMSGCNLSGIRAAQSNGATCCPQSSSSCNDNDAHIMSPVAATNTLTFSPCSIGNVCTMLSGGLNTQCVTTPGQRNTLSTQQCGNGILEPGEECDAGPNGSSCCTNQCKLTSGAQCDPTSSPCCTGSCRFAGSTQLCRPAKDNSTCDTPEYCTGNSATCPQDTYKPNGESCGSNGLACANGRCTSRDQQCQAQTSRGQEFTQACPVRASQSCSVACQTDSSSSTCTLFQTNFIDGTPCGYGGYCQNGKCESSGWQNAFQGWYRNNLNIAIPVTIVIAIIVLLILAAIARRCCCTGARRRNPKAAAGGRQRSRRGLRNNGAVASSSFQPQPPPMRTSNGYAPGTTPYSTYAPPQGPPPTAGNPGGPPAVPPRSSRSNWVDPSAYNGR